VILMMVGIFFLLVLLFEMLFLILLVLLVLFLVFLFEILLLVFLLVLFLIVAMPFILIRMTMIVAAVGVPVVVIVFIDYIVRWVYDVIFFVLVVRVVRFSGGVGKGTS